MIICLAEIKKHFKKLNFFVKIKIFVKIESKFVIEKKNFDKIVVKNIK